MSSKKRRFEIGLISNELYQALSEVAKSEDTSMAQLARQALEDAFLVDEPELDFPDNVRVFALSEADVKRLLGVGDIPVVGQVVDDPEMGNRVEFYGEAA